jgi:hypothetical protein
MTPEFIITKILNTKSVLGMLPSNVEPVNENVIIKFEVDEFIPSTEKDVKNLLVLNMFINADAESIRDEAWKYNREYTMAVMDVLWSRYNLDVAYWDGVLIQKFLKTVGLENTRVELYVYDKEGNFIFESK